MFPVGAVRVSLAFDRHAGAVGVLSATDARRTPLQEIARIDMCRRLRRQDTHTPTALRIVQHTRFAQLALLVTVDRPTLVIAVPDAQRLVIGIDIACEGFWLREIHRSPLHVDQLAGRDAVPVVPEEFRRIELQFLLHRTARMLTLEVEIGSL